MRADIETPQPDVEEKPRHRDIDVEGQPGRYAHRDSAGAQRHIADGEQHPHQPGEGDRRIVQHQDQVVQAASPRQLPQPAHRLGHHDLVGAACPSQLLAEEVGPRRRPLADSDNIGCVHRFPPPAGFRVARPVHGEGGGQILGDRILEPADLLPCRDTVGVVRPDEHSAVEPVRGALDH